MRFEFSDFLKHFRERHDLTQEQFVQVIYDYDDEEFLGVDTVTLSRWERGQTKPSKSRQLKLFKALQAYSDQAFPIAVGDKSNIEEYLCKVATARIIGKSAYLVFDVPPGMMKPEHIVVNQLRNLDDYKRMIPFFHALHRDHTEDELGLMPEHFASWALHPGSLFLVAIYYGQISGALFSLRLKRQAAEAVREGALRLCDIRSEEHLADFGEPSVVWPFIFFAYSMANGSLLLIRHYAHLIAHQEDIEGLGAIAAHADGAKMIERFGMEPSDTDLGSRRLTLYYAPLKAILGRPPVLEMIFSKQDCPEG
jgi:transcriptional regulator with XRE-family HTH domain